jgi:hypothetical protein
VGTAACRYVDNGDGTVSDLNTGLLWEKKDTVCPGPHCYEDRFNLGTFADRSHPTGTVFTEFLYGLDGGTSTDGTATSGCFLGFCDWRLPRIDELVGIVDRTQGQCGGGSGPCIDAIFGPEPTPFAVYWSSTTDGDYPGIYVWAWVVSLVNGQAADGASKTMSASVRAVRGGLAVPTAGQPHPGAPQLRCEQAKLRAQGKLEDCLKANAARVVSGRLGRAEACHRRFQAALSRADRIGLAAGATPCRYIDNGDGTVSDLNTGLVWEQKDQLDYITDPEDPHDADNTYAWSESGDAPDGSAFIGFLGALNQGLSTDGMSITGCFAGQCDWRLPLAEELNGLLDPTRGSCSGGSGACVDPTFSPTSPFYYWSATNDAGFPGLVWDIFFEDGTVGFDPKVNLLNARAVRGGL